MAERTRLTFVKESWLSKPLTIGVLAGALALEACGSDHPNAHTNPAQHTSSPTVEATSSTQATHELIFDDLGGGSSIIQVYPGVGRSLEDKKANGTFNDNDVVGAECKTEGRSIHSDPSVGEEQRTSDKWIKIDGSPGKEQFATAVYVKNPDQLLRELPNC